MKRIILILFVAFVFQSCSRIIMPLPLLQNLAVVAGAGKAGISGGDSWEDPLGVQVSLESRFIELSESSSITSGLGISFQGANWSEPEYGSGTVNLSYLNLPIIYNYQSPSGFYAEAGLQPGFLLSAKDKYNGMTEDYKYGVKSFELGLPVGAGYSINKNLSIGLRGTLGLTNLDDTGSDVKDHNYMVVGLIRFTPNWSGQK